MNTNLHELLNEYYQLPKKGYISEKIMLELKKEYLSFSHKDELELKRLKEYYNTLSKGK